MTSNNKIHLNNFLFHLFLVSTAMMPFISLFWQVNFLNIKVNWLVYPVLLAGLISTLVIKLRAPASFFFLLFLTVFYLLLSVINAGEVETIFRVFISLAPLTYIVVFTCNQHSSAKYFWWLYALSFSLPMYYAYLQYTGQMPFNDFDSIDDQVVGRVSAGYNKPMNFIAFLLPVYLYGFYKWRVLKKKAGLIVVVLVLLIIYLIGHRTSLFAFGVIFLSSFFSTQTIFFVKIYYKYFLNFFIGIGSLIFFRLLLMYAGVIDIIRGRVPMWESHSQQFLDSSILEILFGTQHVWLIEKYRHPGMLIFEEVHNNSYRTILIFGIAGFFIYCAFMRSIVIYISRLNYPKELQFVVFSCFTYFILYTITNEPIYYGSVLWPILIWIFLAPSTDLREQHN